MSAFKQIKTDDADLSRVQQNVANAFDALPTTSDPKFVTTTAAQYRITGEESYVFVDASAAAVTVVLPPSGAAPVIKRVDKSAQAATVQSSDRTTIDGAATLSLKSLAAARLVFDGKAWWSV